MTQPTPSASDLARLRRMVNEPGTATYTDEALVEYLDRYRLMDVYGYPPPLPADPDTAPSVVNWTPTYDLHASAGDIWEEKAGAFVGDFDFAADGGSYQRSQVRESYIAQANKHRAQRVTTTIELRPDPALTPMPLTDDLWDSDLSN